MPDEEEIHEIIEQQIIGSSPARIISIRDTLFKLIIAANKELDLYLEFPDEDSTY